MTQEQLLAVENAEKEIRRLVEAQYHGKIELHLTNGRIKIVRYEVIRPIK